MFTRKSTAGATELRRYTVRMKEWRCRFWVHRALLALAVAVLLGFGAVRDGPTFMLGLFAGGFACIYGEFRYSVPWFIERHRQGALGENWTAAKLKPLERAGYEVWHDVPTEWGNWDHVVAGPNGIFLIDTKAWSGTLSIDGDHLYVNRSSDGSDDYRRDVGRPARRQAIDLKRSIEEFSGCRSWVQAVVCLWGRFDEGLVRGDNVTFIHGTRLGEWLRSQPTSIRREQIEAASNFLRMRKIHRP